MPLNVTHSSLHCENWPGHQLFHKVRHLITLISDSVEKVTTSLVTMANTTQYKLMDDDWSCPMCNEQISRFLSGGNNITLFMLHCMQITVALLNFVYQEVHSSSGATVKYFNLLSPNLGRYYTRQLPMGWVCRLTWICMHSPEEVARDLMEKNCCDGFKVQFKILLIEPT